LYENSLEISDEKCEVVILAIGIAEEIKEQLVSEYIFKRPAVGPNVVAT